MTPAKSKELFELGGSMFHPEKGPQRTLMCFGFEVDNGWFELLKELITKIKEFHQEGFEVIQVKEKFGGLRFYTGGHTEEIEKLVEAAETKSYQTCEICGAEGKMHTRGSWMKTLCPKCAEKNDYTPEPPEDSEEKSPEVPV